MKTYMSTMKYKAIRLDSDEALKDAEAWILTLLPEDAEMPDLTPYREAGAWAVREATGAVSIIDNLNFVPNFVEVEDDFNDAEVFPEHPDA